MYSTSNNIKFTTYNDVNEVVNELFESLRSKYQDNLEKKKKYLKAYISHHNSIREVQIILLMIPNREKKDGIILTLK